MVILSNNISGLHGHPAAQVHEPVNTNREIERLPSVTVIIPTKNRPNDLVAAVESVLQQGVQQQLIIIDQSQSDEGRSLVEKVLASVPDSVRKKVELNYVVDPTISGLTTARNRAMEFARGQVWLFLDDDVILEPDYLQKILSVYVRHPDVSGVSGVVTNYHTPKIGFRLWSQLFVHGPFRDDRQPIYWAAENLRQAEPIRVTRLGGGLMSFRAETIEGCHFDENLRGVSDGEDIDFCARLAPNAVLVIAPRARLAHYASPARRDKGHWLRRSVRATHYLYWKNWNQGLRNPLCFAWLNVGYVLVAAYAATRRLSLDPCRALWMGIQDSKGVPHT